MKKAVLFFLTLVVLLFLTGCSNSAQNQRATTDGGKEEAAMERGMSSPAKPEHPPEKNGDSTGQQKTGEGNSPEGQPESGAPSEILIKTDNSVSNQEADAMLDALEEELNQLLVIVEQLDAVDEKDLQY